MKLSNIYGSIERHENGLWEISQSEFCENLVQRIDLTDGELKQFLGCYAAAYEYIFL